MGSGPAVLSAGERPPGKRLRVLTSFLPVYCLAAQVAGDRAEVVNLLPANVGPHDYQFSRRDIEKVAQADLVLINGLGLETWLDKLLRNAGGSRRVVAISEGLEQELITQRPGGTWAGAEREVEGGAPNPHIWLDPRLAMVAVSNIQQALGKADPANATAYQANAAACLKRLEALDAQYAAGLAGAKGAPLVTFHDAFAYLARRYGLRVVGVLEAVPGVAPSPRYLAELRRAMAAEHVKVILNENQEASSRLVRQFARDTGAAVAVLDTLESGPLTPGAYEEGMRGNLRVLQRHLAGERPGQERPGQERPGQERPGQIRNPKSEIRKKPEIRNPNPQVAGGAFGRNSGFGIRASDFFRVSGFGFRIS